MTGSMGVERGRGLPLLQIKWTAIFQNLPWIYLLLDVLLGAQFLRIGIGLTPYDTTHMDFFRLGTDVAVRLLVASVALGILTMALIQTLKAPLRARLHRKEIQRWIRDDGLRTPNVHVFLDQVGRNQANALLQLPAEELIAQIQAAAEAITFSPDRIPDGHASWFLVQVLGMANEWPEGATFNIGSNEMDRSGLNYFIQRRMDTLQVAIRYRWRAIINFLSMHVALLLSILAIMIFYSWGRPVTVILVIAIPLSILAVFFASLARDMTAIVERLRR